jgi:DNA-binding NarL/FixJ family response regulator
VKCEHAAAGAPPAVTAAGRRKLPRGTRGYISKAERTKYLRKVARTMRVDVDDLFTGQYASPGRIESHITQARRALCRELAAAGFTKSAIATALMYHHSTVSRYIHPLEG